MNLIDPTFMSNMVRSCVESNINLTKEHISDLDTRGFTLFNHGVTPINKLKKTNFASHELDISETDLEWYVCKLKAYELTDQDKKDIMQRAVYSK